MFTTISFITLFVAYAQSQSHGAVSYSSSNIVRGGLGNIGGLGIVGGLGNGGGLGNAGGLGNIGGLGLGVGLGGGIGGLGGNIGGLNGIGIGGLNNGGYGGHSIDYHAVPKYEYKYGVEDPHTGDKKTQSEVRNGDHTNGEYSLVEPGGTILTVRYSVVGKSGWNAIVSRTGHAVHPINGPRHISGY